MAKIQYDNKQKLIDNPALNINKVTAEDMNEVKTSVNALYDNANGWCRISDTEYNVGNKFVVEEEQRLLLPNNGLSVNTDQMPTGVSSFYDLETGLITPENEGDLYVLRVSFTCSNSAHNGLAEMDLDIGGGQGVILATSFNFPKGTNIEFPYSISNLVFTDGTFIANGGSLYIKGIVGDTSIWDISYVIGRVHKRW